MATAHAREAADQRAGIRFDVARSLVHHGFNKIIFINGHGSNTKVVDPVLRMNMEERFRAVTQRSLEVLMDKLTQTSSSVPDALALQAAALGAKSLGFGVPQTQVNVGIDLRGALEEAQARREARYGGLALVGAAG